MDNEEIHLSISWEKAKVIAGVIASVLLPLSIAIVGHLVNTAIKENERQLKFIELSVSILKTKPQPETDYVRGWAITILETYSPVEIDKITKEQLSRKPLVTTQLRDKAMELTSSLPGKLSKAKTREEMEQLLRERDAAMLEYTKGLREKEDN